MSFTYTAVLAAFFLQVFTLMGDTRIFDTGHSFEAGVREGDVELDGPFHSHTSCRELHLTCEVGAMVLGPGGEGEH